MMENDGGLLAKGTSRIRAGTFAYRGKQLAYTRPKSQPPNEGPWSDQIEGC